MRPLLLVASVAAIVLIAGCPPKAGSPPATTPTAPPETKSPASTPSTAGNPAAEEAAVAAADAWLKLLDAGKYDECWAQMSSFAKSAAPQTAFVSGLKPFRDPLGSLVSRKVQSKQYATSLPGAPDGEYVVIQFQASFAKKQTAIETVTPMKDADGTWRVSGYFIK